MSLGKRKMSTEPVQRLVEECVLAVQDGFLQSALDQVIVDWGAKASHIMPIFLRTSQSTTAVMRYAESKFTVAAGLPALMVITSIASCPMERER